MINVRVATVEDEPQLNLISKLSPFTRDFSNPPMSLKATRKAAIPNGEVLVAEHRIRKGGVISDIVVGFVWARPMKAKHMPFSTIYYMGVVPAAQRKGVARRLVAAALKTAKCGVIEAITEDGNAASSAFFAEFPGTDDVRYGTVGKDKRPYTRWRIR